MNAKTLKEEEMKYEIGDKVMVIEANVGEFEEYKGKTGTIIKICCTYEFPYKVSFDKESGLALWSKVELIERSKPMSKYQSLKERIDNVTAWDKEADDIMREICKNLPEKINGKYCKEMALTIKVTAFNSEYMVFTARNTGIFGQDISPIFNYSSQCEKLEAFKKAMMYLLDNSDIKKDLCGTTQQVKIEGKIYEAEIIKEV